MQTTPVSISPARQNLLEGFTHIPLYRSDLLRFGDELEVGARMLRAVHRDHVGRETGREIIRGGAAGGFSFTAGGTKGLFRSPVPDRCTRLVLVDGPLPAICLAALEQPDIRAVTTYAAPGGPMTRAAEAALATLAQIVMPHEVVLAFAPAGDGLCRSSDICREVLASLLLPCTPRVRTMQPSRPDGWVEALRAARGAARAA